MTLFDSANYNYPVPLKMVQDHLAGQIFRKKDYTPGESSNLKLDIEDIFKTSIAENPPTNRKLIVTAGAPGAGKSTLLEQLISTRKVAYMDPDRVCLQQMKRTYKTENLTTPDEKKNAYDKWRDGSNASTFFCLNALVKNGYDIAYGTTSSAPQTKGTFEFFKAQGYEIELIHISAPDEERWKSIEERDKEFVQTTQEDVVNKGALVPQRLNDTYKLATKIHFYFREKFDESGVLAATWTAKDGIEVVNEKALEGVKAIQNLYAAKLNRDDLTWENSFP